MSSRRSSGSGSRTCGRVCRDEAGGFRCLG
jgi:hypothetical protein